MDKIDCSTYFSPVILERGYDYMDQVESLELIDENNWRAKVFGTEMYTVEITIENNSMKSAWCDCPYDYERYCKHIAAALLNINKKNSDSGHSASPLEKTKSRKEGIIHLLKQASKQDIKDFLIEKACEDDTLYADLCLHFGGDMESKNLELLREIIQVQMKTAMGRDHFIDYYHTEQAMQGAWKVLTSAQEHLSSGNFMTAFQMAALVLEEVYPVMRYCDDSNGTVRTIIEEAMDFLYTLSDQDLTDDEADLLFCYALKQTEHDDYAHWELESYLNFYRIARKCLRNEKNTLKLLSLISNLIENPESGVTSSYMLHDFIVIKMEILEYNGNHQESEDLLKQYHYIPDFRRIELQDKFKRKKYIKVIAIALEAEKHDAAKPGLIHEWRQWRFKSYKKMNKQDEIRKLSREFIKSGKLDYYTEWKETICKDDFPTEFNKLIEDIKKGNTFGLCRNAAEILIKENKFAELLTEIKKDPYWIRTYYKHLLPDFTKEVFSLYENEIRKQASIAQGRKQYSEVCRELITLKKIDKEKTVSGIINELAAEYRKKPAFLDELANI